MSLARKEGTLSVLLLLYFVICVRSESKGSKFNTAKFRLNSGQRLPSQTSTSIARFRKKEVNITTTARRGLQWNVSNIATIMDGVPVWSRESERLMREGFSDRHVRQWQEETRRLQIKEILPGQCGRSPNALVILDDGRKACSRIRENGNAIMGDSYSFALSRLLGTKYVPSTILADTRTKQWQAAASYFKNYGKDIFPLVLLTEWIGDVRNTYVPQILTKVDSQVRPETLPSLRNEEIRDLIQWTDMIVFDYLTVNTDRMISLLYNRQWNKEIMKHSVRNLLQQRDGLLLFFDNEHGLIFGQAAIEQLDVYRTLHSQMLNSTCVFRQNTVEKIKELSQSKDIGKTLNETLKHLDPLAKKLGLLARRYTDRLQDRIDRVYRHMKTCYGGSK